MIVLTKHFPNGEVSHCTALCYNSSHKKCTCICKGLLHGMGEAYAKRGAVRASVYLNMSGDSFIGYFPASELLPDTEGR